MKTKEAPKVALVWNITSPHIKDCKTESIWFRIIHDHEDFTATLFIKNPNIKERPFPFHYREDFQSVDQAEERANELANQLFQDLKQFVK